MMSGGTHTRQSRFLRLGLAGLTVLLVQCGQEKPALQNNGNGEIAKLTISDGPIYDFGTVDITASREKMFAVTNRGIRDATDMGSAFFLSLNFNYKGGAYPGDGGSCADTLAPNASCSVIVVFAPQYEGDFESAIQIDYHNGAVMAATSEPILKGRGSDLQVGPLSGRP